MSFQDERKRPFGRSSASDRGSKEKLMSKRARSGFRTRPLSADKGFGRTNDEIHSSIQFCPVMHVIMDTKQFQRLRHLKQLGTAEQAFINCNHNRMEHSMGVAHLSKWVCEVLMKRQPNLQITEKDVLCVKIAGLLHDLGHGPFSHVYDGYFRKQLAKHIEANPELKKFYDNLPPVDENWHHEDASLMMIDALLADLGLEIDMDHLDKPLKQIGDGVDAKSMRVYHQWEDKEKKIDQGMIMTSRDWVFIKECIIGAPIHKKERLAPNESGFIGRPYCGQEFLYDIVANRHTGLDVDKIDYFARDQRRAERQAGEIELRMIEEAVVAWGICPKPHKCFRCDSDRFGRHLMICYPEKMVEHAVAFFNKRFDLHSKIYTHKTSIAATTMVCDILTLADPHFEIPTFLEGDDIQTQKNGMPWFLPISRAMLHPVSYLRLRDSVIEQIMATTKPELREARILIQRFWDRKLYKCAATKKIDLSNENDEAVWAKSEQQIEDEILLVNGKHDVGDGETITLERGDVIVKMYDHHHGANDDNPLTLMRFLPKSNLSRLTRPIDDLPEALQADPKKHKSHMKMAWKERSISVFCRGSEEKLDLLRHTFSLWESQVEENGRMTVLEDDEASYGSTSNCDEPVALTQESDTMTPMKHDYGSDFFDASPIDASPIPTCNQNGQQSAKRKIF